MGLNHSPRIVTNGLVLCLDAANRRSYPGSGTTWTDLSGNGNNGTLTNGPTFDSGNGGSLVFDGTNDHINISSQPLQNNASFTISTFVRFTNFNDSVFKSIVDSGNFGGGTLGYCLAKNNSNRLYVAVNAGFVEIGTAIANNTWYNVTCTANFGNPYTLKIFVNGVEQTATSSANTSSLTISQSAVRCFTNIVGILSYTSGRQSFIQIYNRALTAAEIQQNFNATRGRYGL